MEVHGLHPRSGSLIEKHKPNGGVEENAKHDYSEFEVANHEHVALRHALAGCSHFFGLVLLDVVRGTETHHRQLDQQKG